MSSGLGVVVCDVRHSLVGLLVVARLLFDVGGLNGVVRLCWLLCCVVEPGGR